MQDCELQINKGECNRFLRVEPFLASQFEDSERGEQMQGGRTDADIDINFNLNLGLYIMLTRGFHQLHW